MAVLLDHKALQEGWLVLGCVLLESRGLRHWLLGVRLLFPSNLARCKLFTFFTRLGWICFIGQGFMVCIGKGTHCKVGKNKASVPITACSNGFTRLWVKRYL